VAPLTNEPNALILCFLTEERIEAHSKLRTDKYCKHQTLQCLSVPGALMSSSSDDHDNDGRMLTPLIDHTAQTPRKEGEHPMYPT